MAELEKCVWTDRDFDVMGWHDATVHAMTVDWDPVVLEGGWHGATLLLDIDYIVTWIHHGPGETIHFEVAPATLVFEDVWDIEGELESRRTMSPPQILDLNRGDADEQGLADWEVDGDRFALRFRARGFYQHFRARPIANGDAQSLSSARRGGPSFATPSELPG
jgi:hypothetical protein